jgi:hypothetical protein
VPELIRALASPDGNVREQAYHRLRNTLWYQGSLVEATPSAVPFLIELVAEESVEEQDNLLDFLVNIATGGTFLEGSGALNDYADEASAPPDLQAELAKQRGWVQQAYEAVERGVPVYLTLLTHPAASTRMKALYLLSFFPRQALVMLPSVQAHLAREDHLWVQATAVWSLGNLLQRESSYHPLLRTLLNEATHPLLRCVAALACVRCARDATSPEVVEALLEAVEGAADLELAYGGLPFVWVDDSVIGDVCRALCMVESAQAIPALREILHRWPFGPAPVERSARRDSLVNTLVEVIRSLLGVAFVRREVPGDRFAEEGRVAGLTQTQRAVLTEVVNYDPLWELDLARFFVDRDELFGDYGLPSSRRALRKLLWVVIPHQALEDQ